MDEPEDLISKIGSLDELEATLGPVTDEEQALLDAMAAEDYWHKNPITPAEAERARKTAARVMQMIAKRKLHDR